MRKNNEEPLKDAIDRFLKLYKLDDRLLEIRVREVWKELLGSMIDKRTLEIHLRKNILYVKLDSASLKNELTYAKSTLIEKINKELRQTVVRDIVIK